MSYLNFVVLILPSIVKLVEAIMPAKSGPQKAALANTIAQKTLETLALQPNDITLADAHEIGRIAQDIESTVGTMKYEGDL